MKTAENKELEEGVFKWFFQQRALGNPLSGPIICQKAKLLAEKINSLSLFKVSNDWLWNFKARHGFREFDLRKTSAPGHKVNKARVTVLNCANYGKPQNTLPLLLIGKSKNPQAFENVKKLPLFYKNQPKGWMTAALFTEWYDSIFIPEVKKYHMAIGKEGSKVMLSLDNTPTHPTESLLDRRDGCFKTLFLQT
ncbi:hypothetical protein PR048_002821 [Dryococelus australis]|uniref:HTH CENPB-type domain-containing protein n=1 Tax=Dryococelus australis TaxID=614101 RepID=A0ABQ9IMR7_9NEOP|nr:hypothetical protein PR048_002821 [Dryococelus australis]